MIPNEEKERSMALSSSIKTIYIIKRNKKEILKFNQYINSGKMPYIIYAGIESSIKKMDGCANNPENSLATNIGQYIPCGYSMSTIWAFDHIKNRHIFFCI